MATAEAALEKMREICLSLPDTSEGVHFGQTAFHVKGKLWAICGDKYGVWQIAFGLELDHAAALAESDPRFKLHPRDKRGVVVDVADVKSWGEIEALLLESYRRMTPQKKPARAAAKKPARAAAQKPARAAATKPAKGAAKKPARAAATKPAKGAAKKPARAAATKPAKGAAKKPARAAATKPAKGAAKKPAKGTAPVKRSGRR